MKDTTKNKIFIGGIFLIILFGTLLVLKVMPKDPIFSVYKEGIEVEVFELQTGIELPIGYNESLFLDCVLLNQNVSRLDFYDNIIECFGDKAMKVINVNVTKEDLSYQWVYANCDELNESFQCGTYEVKIK